MATEMLIPLATVSTGAVSLCGVLLGIMFNRVSKIERELSLAKTYNDDLWVWTRLHLDLYLTHRKPNSPDPFPIPERQQHV